MLADGTGKQYIRTNFTALRKKLNDDLILFLENCLNFFPSIYKKHFQSSKYMDEREVTPLFSNYLSNNSRSKSKPYNFTHQYPQTKQINKTGKSREIDIGVTLYTKDNYDFNPIFVIECKWLRSPSLSKQYVSGDTGGIERFKRELHGKGLKDCALIGYIENESFEFWFNTINTWIKNLSDDENNHLTWKESEILKKVGNSAITTRYISIHKRIGDYIKLHHLWVKMQIEE